MVQLNELHHILMPIFLVQLLFYTDFLTYFCTIFVPLQIFDDDVY